MSCVQDFRNAEIPLSSEGGTSIAELLLHAGWPCGIYHKAYKVIPGWKFQMSFASS